MEVYLITDIIMPVIANITIVNVAKATIISIRVNPLFFFTFKFTPPFFIRRFY